MKQVFDQASAIKVYAELMRLMSVAASSECASDGSSAEDGIEESLEHLDVLAAQNGLKFVPDAKHLWALEAMTGEEKAAFAASQAACEEIVCQLAAEQQRVQMMCSHVDRDEASEGGQANVRDQL